MLGLINIHDFCRTHKEEAARLLELGTKGKVWFFFAVTGIHLTCWLCEFLQEGVMDTCFYRPGEVADIFQDVYRWAFVRFGKFWVDAKPVNLMDYGRISVCATLLMRV